MISVGLKRLVFNSGEFPVVANMMPAADIPNPQNGVHSNSPCGFPWQSASSCSE